MRIRTYALGIGACALTVGAMAAAQQLARASQNACVVQRFLLGYLDKRGRFVATNGRNATNVDRNALAMVVFSGAVDSGPNTRATLPLTLEEFEDLQKKIQEDPKYNPARDGYEPGAFPRRRSDDPAALLVATGSVSPFSIQFVAGSALAEGQLFKFLKPGTSTPAPTRVLFNPRYRVETGNPAHVDYNPEALAASTVHTVYVDGGPNPFNAFQLVRNRDGKPLAAPFTTTFTTNNRYVQDFTRPEVRSFLPGDTAQNVAYDADIDLTFDEAMDVSSFVQPRFQGDTVYTILVHYSTNPINGALRDRNILGDIRVKPQTAGNVVQFRPIQGFGKGPYEVEVVVTNGVTDLSGNNIIRQFQFTFRTESNPVADDFSQVEENFVNITKSDFSFVPAGDYQNASWNREINIRPSPPNPPPTVPGSPLASLGELSTGIREVAFELFGAGASAPNSAPIVINPNTASQYTGWPGVNVWFSRPIRVQMFYPAGLMGGRPRSISGCYWVQGRLIGRTYPGMQLQLAHANDAVDAAGLPTSGPSDFNFFGAATAVVPKTTYRTGIAATTGTYNEYVKMPDFFQAFDYDGARGMILDLQHNGDPANAPTPAPPPWPPNTLVDNYERWRNDGAYTIRCSTVAIQNTNNTVTIQTNQWLYSTRLLYLSPGAEAQSFFYDIGRNDARLLPQQIVPTTQPAGTSVVFLWQGAKDDPNAPGTPDLTSLSAWVSDIRQLSTYRFVRFRATLNNNTRLRVSPKIDILRIPFVYK